MGNDWWKYGVLYQIYPRSFMDSNGDGVGDLRGIIQRLDYLAWLGVDAIWLSPIYPSPMADFGYDVSDYTDIAPLFGTLDDFDELLSETHRHGLRMILDFVPNHTSDQWRGRLSRGRGVACDQGRRVPRRASEPRLSSRATTLFAVIAHLPRRPA